MTHTGRQRKKEGESEMEKSGTRGRAYRDIVTHTVQGDRDRERGREWEWEDWDVREGIVTDIVTHTGRLRKKEGENGMEKTGNRGRA